MGLEIGDVIDGKYKILRLLGEGGMGAVFEGENTRIHRRVAIKVLHGDVAGNDEAVTRFEREAQAAGRIGSEHIVEVLDLGDLPGGERYMVMEFLQGEALNDRIAKGRMAPRDIGALMVDMLEGLKAAHAAQIVHRDLKPDNVFLLSNKSGKKDFVKIVDFGISKFNALGSEFSMTRTGAVMGTPYYMAPEQAKGGSSVDHRVDIYAVGVILYQAVVGKVPFDAETFNELLFKIVLETPPPLADLVEGVDPDYVVLVNKAMAREPSDRFQTAEEFQSALQAWLGGRGVAAARTVVGGTPTLDKTALHDAPGAMMQTAVGLAGSEESVDAGASGEQGTQGAWANGEGPAGVPAKKGPPLALFAALGLLVMGGVGAALFQSGEDKEAKAEAAVQAEAESAAEKRRALDEAETAAQLESLRADKLEAESARAKAEAAQSAAEEKKSALESKTTADAAARLAEKERAAAATRRANSARSRAKPATKAASPSPRPASSPRSGGRVIRTTL